MSELLCLGLGYTARALAARLDQRDWQIAGSSVDEEGAGRIAALGYTGLIFDGARPSKQVSNALASATHLLVSAPPAETGDPVLACHGAEIARAQRLAWIGYLSTVGVYGDRQGAWVDEDTEPHPTSGRSRRRLEAEVAWRDLASKTGKRLQIFRLAGIYGPARSALDAVRAGKARRIIKAGQVFNRIHVDDIVSVLVAAMTGRGCRALYNVADDEPAPPQDVTAFAAQLLGMPTPPAIAFADAGLGPMAASFYSESKRVSNARIKEDLGISLAFPTYREGLAALVDR